MISSKLPCLYPHFHNYSHTKKRKLPEELKTLDIGTRLLDNAAFVRIHVVERFSIDFLEVRRLRSRFTLNRSLCAKLF